MEFGLTLCTKAASPIFCTVTEVRKSTVSTIFTVVGTYGYTLKIIDHSDLLQIYIYILLPSLFCCFVSHFQKQ